MKVVSSIRFRSDYIMRAWLVAKGFTMRQTVVVIVYWKAKDKGREWFPGKRIWCFLGTARYYCLQLWKLWRYWFGEIVRKTNKLMIAFWHSPTKGKYTQTRLGIPVSGLPVTSERFADTSTENWLNINERWCQKIK